MAATVGQVIEDAREREQDRRRVEGCMHAWALDGALGDGESDEVCDGCGARCRREGGRMVYFSAEGEPYRVDEDRRRSKRREARAS